MGKMAATGSRPELRTSPLTPHSSPNSAAADGDDDFEAVAAGERRVGMLAARNDFTVFFDGDAFSRERQRLDQLGQRERRGESAGLAVDEQFNHKNTSSIRGT